MPENFAKGYTSGNVTDRIKHSNLEELTRSVMPKTYFEFHSGEGIEDDYEGSSLRVLRIMSQQEDYHAFLNESDNSRRGRLIHNIRDYARHTTVKKDWRKNIEHYLNIAQENSLFLIDPSYISDYHEDKGILDWFERIINTDSTIFMYLPERVSGDCKKKQKCKETLETIANILRNNKRSALDLRYPSFNGGCFGRIDHNIIVSDPDFFSDLCDNHVKICSSKDYKRMKDFSEYVTVLD